MVVSVRVVCFNRVVTFSFQVPFLVVLFFFPFFFKIIKGKEDARSVVRYQFKEPFVTNTLQIFPDVDISQLVYLRTEVYGCRPTLGNGIISLY